MVIYLLAEPEKVPKYLMCTLCKEVFDRPVRLSCTHCFCKGCIDTWTINKKNCPDCRKKVNKNQIAPDLIATSLVNDIKVKCRDHNCIWEGRLEDLSSHLCKLADSASNS